MSNKTRKHMWPVSLVMTVAIIGALAAFLVLANNPGAIMAQGDPCAGMTPEERAAHILNGGMCGTPNEPPTVTAPAMDTIVIEGVMVDGVNNTHTVEGVRAYFSDPEGDDLTFNVGSSNTSAAAALLDSDGNLVITAQGAGEATITVTATDADGSNMSAVLEIMVSVRLSPAERYGLIPASVEFDAPAMEQVTFTVTAVDADNTPLDEDATVSLLITQFPAESSTSPLVTRVIGLDSSLDNDITDDDILQGLLTVRATDPDGKRGFTVYFECTEAGERVEIQMLDEDPQVVGSASISCKVPPAPEPDADQITASECYSITASMAENEAMDEMRDDVLSHERPAHPTNPEIGQDTIEILNGTTDVQITVTSCEAGPVYIRFLDSDGDVFGTDIDECETCEGASGADVVGLDSQQKLEMNLGPDEMDAAMALMYDQYNVVTPGDGSDMYLTGKPGMYYQGKFRFIAPCDWEPFEVEVYEKNGKVRQELENGMFSQTVSCVASPKPGPAGLVFEIAGQKPGEGELRFDPVENAIGHTALLIDASNRNIVSTVDPAVSPVAFDNLNNGWTYHIVVIAEGEDDQYTADAVMDYGLSWLGEDDVPLSTDPSADPTRMHPLCQVDDANITALLSDCDPDPVNTAPMAVGTIAPVTVTAGQMSEMDVSGYFSDADMDDTLTYTAMSDMTMYATATVDNMGMVTITGVAAGSATVTVTATDMDGAYAMQTVMVTVTAAELAAPTGVMAAIDDSDPGVTNVTITWTNGANADGHEVGLVDLSDYSVRDHRVTDGATSHTFTNVASGRYMAIVVSTMDTEYDYDVDIVTVP